MTTLQRRHFQIIADIIARIPDKYTRADVALLFVSELKHTNPKFKVHTFYKACGVQS